MNVSEHVRRAEALATRYPAAAELLRAYARQVPTSSWEPASGGCVHVPQVAVLRPEGDGARRFLVCGRCAHEWTYPRIQCPNCQERSFENLPVYIAPDYPHLRVECCLTCHHYLIAADLVKDCEAIPLVDDLAAIALHFWAEEHGYTKIDSRWFGINLP